MTEKTLLIKVFMDGKRVFATRDGPIPEYGDHFIVREDGDDKVFGWVQSRAIIHGTTDIEVNVHLSPQMVR